MIIDNAEWKIKIVEEESIANCYAKVQMLAYIKGSLETKNNDYIVIDVGGLGYKVNMSKKALETVGNIGDKIKVYTYYRVREDDISIFGFNTNEELRMFELLLSVSGIGAKVALTILSNIVSMLCITSSDLLHLITECL